jgi:hypothetical protein
MAATRDNDASIAEAEDEIIELEARLKDARSRLETLKLNGTEVSKFHPEGAIYFITSQLRPSSVLLSSDLSV